jgi:hypothetical protein
MTQPLFSAKCPPQKPYNTVRRSREYLTPEEVEQLLHAARRQGCQGSSWFPLHICGVKLTLPCTYQLKQH